MLNQQELATLQALLGKVMEGLHAQVYGPAPALAAPQTNPMFVGAAAPAPQAASPVPSVMPTTNNPVTESGVHVGRIALWQSSATAQTSYNGKLEIHAQSGDPKNPDAVYKVFLKRNTDPNTQVIHSGSISAVDANDNTTGNVGTVRVIPNTLNQDPSTIAVVYVDFDNGFSISGPMKHQGGTSPSGSRMPDVVGNVYFNAAGAAQPTMPAAPAMQNQMAAPVMPAVVPSVQPQVGMMQPTMPAAPINGMMQEFFTQAPSPQPMAAPQAAAPTGGMDIASMTPQQMAEFALRSRQNMGM